ncbi:enoyl-CoA hydratase [compost metagenome]
MALAQRLAKGPTVALGHLRRLMRGSLDRDLASQLDAESAAFQSCAATADFRIGLDAFFGKKPAAFTGR